MMAAALGPPEVIAQLENAAKVLMVSTPRPPHPSICETLAGTALPGFPSAGLATDKGLQGALEVEEVAVAWRRILHPTFLPSWFPLLPGAVHFP